ncbi:MAG: SagB/ThcOx family dehydrogenase [Rubrivivax sp.]|nr:SagB/ThcOx family dehydrogenase [Rubrivivax sp.]
MDKLAWVLLPLMLAVGAAGVWALRRRMPSRLALNVWSSVLLMAYVLTTAGLGIFWVANQHLPVFDWHYLFGYATVLLLVVHLAFNFRVVWRHFSPHRLAAAAPPGAAPAGATTPRRHAVGALGVLGAVVAGGGAFWLGVRQGRTEIHVPPGPAAGATAGGQAMAVVEQFHEFSAHSRAGVFRRAAGTQWAAQPPPFKAYPGALQVVLPSAGSLRSARADAPGMPLDIDLVARVLWCSAGVNQVSAGIHFRTAPSSGALFATELYLCARRVAGLAPGWWHYDGRAHRLNRVAGLKSTEPGAAAELVATAIFARSGHKYRDRTYRYVLGDLGHLLENARATAAALGSGLVPQRLFDESVLARELGLDEAQEGVLARLWFDEAAAGAAAAAVADAPPATTALRLPSAQPGPWAAPALAQASQTQVLGVTDAVHLATSLRAGDGPPTPPAPVPAAAVSPPALQLPPPSPVVLPAEVQALIARRRSVRRFSDQALPLATLGTVLHHMAQGHPPLFSDAVRLDLVTHAVQGLPSTAWRYDAARHALLRRRDDTLARQAAHRAALDQDVIGDAAVVFVLSMARAALAHDAGGPARGYRHAFIESGLVGERLYLAAVALGLGVCAVGAFYDDEAARLVAVDPAREWVVHLAALGVPS